MKLSVLQVMGVVFAAVLLGAVVAVPLLFLWNGCLVGAIDGVNNITYLQAWGLLLISNALFKVSIGSSLLKGK